MKLLLVTTSVLAIFAGVAEARHVGTSLPVVGSECIYTEDNGCLNSPGGNFQIANFYTGWTGTVYATRPDANMPCIDYKCGMPAISNPLWSGTFHGITITGACGMDNMVDPKTAEVSLVSNDPGCGIMPKNCAYSETVVTPQLTQSWIICSNTSDRIVLRGFNLGPTGGHKSTYFLFNSNHTGDKVVAFNHMEADEGVYSANGFGSFGSGSQGISLQLANNQYGNWLEDWFYRGNGVASYNNTTKILSVSDCTGDGCNFRVGQRLNQVSNGYISEQVSGTPNGVGEYRITGGNAVTLAPGTAVTTQFSMGGGMGINTISSVYSYYNMHWQVNGRIATASQRNALQTNTNVPEVANYHNFVNGGIYTFGISHWEYYEYVLGNGQNPMTWDQYNNIGNVVFYDEDNANASVTATFFISTGDVANKASNFNVHYGQVRNNWNTIVAKGGVQGSAALATWGGAYVDNLTQDNNYIDLGVASYYSLCNGSPAIGSTIQNVFFLGSQTGNKVTVSTWQGGVDIMTAATDPNGIGMHFFEGKGYFLSQDSGTPGREGVYTMSNSATVSSGNRRAAVDGITNIVSVSGNKNLVSGADIPLTTFISRSGGANFCVYPGF